MVAQDRFAVIEQRLRQLRPNLVTLANQSGQTMFDGDDLIQELCLNLLESGRDCSTLHDGWFIVTARNILRTAGRRRGCWRKYCEFRANWPNATFPPPGVSIEANELGVKVRRHVQRLPCSERMEVERRFFSGGTVSKATSTARTRFHRAKRHLRD
jgi:DNA-directed RNA polymerase specialized sigma24 family protein